MTLGAAASRRASWARRPERSNMAMLRLMSWISLRLGRRVARGVLRLIAVYFLIFAPAARRASRDYLRRVLGRAPAWRELYRHFLVFASTIHDRVYLINDRFDLFEIEVEGAAVMENVLAARQGAFLMGAHLGSFEAVRAIGRRETNLRVAMVMYEENARKLNAMLAAINPAAQQAIIPLGQIDSMLKVRAALDSGAMLGVLADRSLDDEPGLILDFLGSSARFPLGPMRLAAMLRRPVIFMAGHYLGGNRYRIYFERLADFANVRAGERDAAVQRAVADYAACLERHCRMAPYNWFNFFDFWSPAKQA